MITKELILDVQRSKLYITSKSVEYSFSDIKRLHVLNDLSAYVIRLGNTCLF